MLEFRFYDFLKKIRKKWREQPFSRFLSSIPPILAILRHFWFGKVEFCLKESKIQPISHIFIKKCLKSTHKRKNDLWRHF